MSLRQSISFTEFIFRATNRCTDDGSPQPEKLRQLRLHAGGDPGPVKAPEVCDQGQRAGLQVVNRLMRESLRIEVHRGQVGQHRGCVAGLNDSRQIGER